MLFASFEFLFGFLPAVLVATYLARRFYGPRGALAVLASGSLIFYSWYYPPFLILLLGSVGTNFVLARIICRTPSRFLVGFGVAMNLALLGWFKYAGFFASVAEAISGSLLDLPDIALPLGISFFTFQQIAYLVDTYEGKVRPDDPLEYLFFVSFFPQLIAGPIVHHKELMPQLGKPRFSRFLSEDLLRGLMLLSIGLAKKILIADSLAPGADAIFEARSLGVPLSASEAWIGMLCYTFQIYFDFSAYADMAIGLGLLFGLKIPENFRSPYKSTSIIEFWRRWHISLSTFLRDYLYLPLGGNRKGKARRYLNLWIVMLLGGLWHGAGWQFVVWGGLHGFYLTVAHFWRAREVVRIRPAAGAVLTFLAVVVAWVFFRAPTVEDAFAVIMSMLGTSQTGHFDVVVFVDFVGLLFALVSAALIAFFCPNAMEVSEKLKFQPSATAHTLRWCVFTGGIAALAVFHLYSSGSHAFIYFQF